jgi:hypothetical protein
METTITSFIHQMTNLGKTTIKIEPWIVVFLVSNFFETRCLMALPIKDTWFKHL